MKTILFAFVFCFAVFAVQAESERECYDRLSRELEIAKRARTEGISRCPTYPLSAFDACMKLEEELFKAKSTNIEKSMRKCPAERECREKFRYDFDRIQRELTEELDNCPSHSVPAWRQCESMAKTSAEIKKQQVETDVQKCIDEYGRYEYTNAKAVVQKKQ